MEAPVYTAVDEGVRVVSLHLALGVGICAGAILEAVVQRQRKTLRQLQRDRAVSLWRRYSKAYRDCR